MPDTPVRLVVPEGCPHCGARGTVALETTISQAGIDLIWWCRQCEHHWPVKRRDEAGSNLAPREP